MAGPAFALDFERPLLELEKKIGLTVTVAPALGRYPAGLRELKSFRTAWYALTATQAKTRAA